ncbi:MAG TPA: YajD family HNH nuclease [Syntrophales bacterium]|nr:YajD family HNH nuclease [Syntrophales bacterium]
MPRVTYGRKGGRVRTITVKDKPQDVRSVEDVVRDLKRERQKLPGEDYREKSIALHGLVCARCGREFNESTRNLLTVHHKDGNHNNNPTDGSNWENLCVYCHEDVHSRGILGEYLEGASSESDGNLAHEYFTAGETSPVKMGSLGDKFKKAMERKVKH